VSARRSHRRAPRPLARALERLSGDLAPATTLARVQAMWPQIAGDAVAAACRPTAERAGVLEVTCSAAVWAQELDLMGPSLVARLNEELGPGCLSGLRCRTG